MIRVASQRSADQRLAGLCAGFLCDHDYRRECELFHPANCGRVEILQMRTVAHGNSISTYVDGEVVNNVSGDTLLTGHAVFALWYNRVRTREPRDFYRNDSKRPVHYGYVLSTNSRISLFKFLLTYFPKPTDP